MLAPTIANLTASMVASGSVFGQFDDGNGYDDDHGPPVIFPPGGNMSS